MLNGTTLPLEATHDPDRARDLCMWLRRRAQGKTDQALAISAQRLSGQAHQRVRAHLGLTVQQYRRAKRWLNRAVQLSVASSGRVTVEQAMHALFERHVALTVRVGMLMDQGVHRRSIQQRLGVDDEQLEMCEEWWRDATTATRRRNDRFPDDADPR